MSKDLKNSEALFLLRSTMVAGFLAIMAIAGAFMGGMAEAAWSIDPTINNLIVAATGMVNERAIASDGSGGAIITWVDYRNGTSNIYAQRMDASGVLQWTTDGVAICTATDFGGLPTITSDGSGGAIIIWTDQRDGYNNLDIYAQRVNESGVVQWTTNGVAISTEAKVQVYPKIVSDGSGGAIITWADGRGFQNYDVYAQRINANGIVQWTVNGVVIATGIRDQWDPRIVSDGRGGAIITWTDMDIYAQRINANGVVQWPANGVSISRAASSQLSPELASDGSGGAIISWVDERSGSDHIYAQRIDSSGIVQWMTDGVAICTAAFGQVSPELVSDGKGGAVITWTDYRNDYNTLDIYAQRINANGVVQWRANGVAIAAGINSQYLPRIASDGSGGAIITWTDQRDGYNNLDIYAQRINAGGVAQWTANGVAISTPAGIQWYSAILSDGKGGAIIAWNDNRSSAPGIYAQRINANGKLGDPPIAPVPTMTEWGMMIFMIVAGLIAVTNLRRQRRA